MWGKNKEEEVVEEKEYMYDVEISSGGDSNCFGGHSKKEADDFGKKIKDAVINRKDIIEEDGTFIVVKNITSWEISKDLDSYDD